MFHKNHSLIMKNTFFSLLTLAIFGLSSCTKTEVTPVNVKTINVTLSGANEVPAVTTTATGMLMGSYNTTTKVLVYSLMFSGITPTAAHFHKGAAGATGGVEFNFGTSITNNMTGTTTLTDAQAADLTAGNWYVNVHSAAKPGGELRGQVVFK